MKAKYLYGLTFIFCAMQATAQNKWKKGILVDEFIYDTASFPQSHASTIAETPDGLIAAWFGGTKRRQ